MAHPLKKSFYLFSTELLFLHMSYPHVEVRLWRLCKATAIVQTEALCIGELDEVSFWCLHQFLYLLFAEIVFNSVCNHA